MHKVRVVGTSFNVCAYKGSKEFETTLVEGIVDIYPSCNDQVITRLQKDEFFANYDGRCKKTILPSYEYLRWKEGLYCFDDVPFSGILDKLEKYYNVKITVTSPRLLTHEGPDRQIQRAGWHRTHLESHLQRAPVQVPHQ